MHVQEWWRCKDLEKDGSRLSDSSIHSLTATAEKHRELQLGQTRNPDSLANCIPRECESTQLLQFLCVCVCVCVHCIPFVTAGHVACITTRIALLQSGKLVGI